MADPRSQALRRSVPALLALVAAAAGAACSHQEELRKADLAELVAWLPGGYDNVDQVQSDTRVGGPGAEPVALIIVAIYAPTIGKDVFFAQETSANDPRRVLFERLLSFAVDKKGSIIQTNYALKDPERWRNAHLNPEVFEGLQPPDLRGIVGCPIVWKRDAFHYTAAEDARVCQSGAPSSVGKPLAELTRDEYRVARRLYDLSVRSIPGAEDPSDRFRKRGSP